METPQAAKAFDQELSHALLEMQAAQEQLQKDQQQSRQALQSQRKASRHVEKLMASYCEAHTPAAAADKLLTVGSQLCKHKQLLLAQKACYSPLSR